MWKTEIFMNDIKSIMNRMSITFEVVIIKKVLKIKHKNIRYGIVHSQDIRFFVDETIENKSECLQTEL